VDLYIDLEKIELELIWSVDSRYLAVGQKEPVMWSCTSFSV